MPLKTSPFSQNLDISIADLPGFGPKRARQLADAGVRRAGGLEREIRITRIGSIARC